MSDCYHIAARKAANAASDALAEEYGCEALHDTGHLVCGFAGMVAPDDRCPEGWRRKKGRWKERDGRERVGFLLVPHRSSKRGRELAARIAAMSSPGTRALRDMLDWQGRTPAIRDTFSHPGIEPFPAGGWVITCGDTWPAPRGAQPIKTSEYYAMKGD